MGDEAADAGGTREDDEAPGHSPPEREEDGEGASRAGDGLAEAASGENMIRGGEPEDAGESNAGESNAGEGADGGGDEEEENGEEEEDGGADGSGISSLPLAAIVEAVLFAAREPLKPAQIARAVGKGTRQDAVRAAIDELNVQYLESSRAFEIAEISGRFQLMSRPEYADHIMRIYPRRELSDKEAKTQKLTPALLDTLAIVAYKQPVMRSEIEHIRGVACGPALRTLIERGSVREAGRRADLVGKPAVFGTTERFLAEFGLGSIEELPMRNEFVLPGAEARIEANLARPEAEQTAPADKDRPAGDTPGNRADGAEDAVDGAAGTEDGAGDFDAGANDDPDAAADDAAGE